MPPCLVYIPLFKCWDGPVKVCLLQALWFEFNLQITQIDRRESTRDSCSWLPQMHPGIGASAGMPAGMLCFCLFSLPISLSYTHERKKRRSNIGLWFENTILSSWSPLNKNYLPLYFCRQVILSFPFTWSCHLLLWLHPFFNLEGCLFLLLLY